MRSMSVQFGWLTREEAAAAYARMDAESTGTGDRLAMYNRAFHETSTAAERLAAKVYNIHNNRGRRYMKAIYCKLCGASVGVMDVPTMAGMKAMLADTKATDTKTAILIAGAQTLLPLLPPEAFDLLTSAMPYYCPACVAEHNIGQLPEDASDGTRISDTESEAPGGGERSPTRAGGGERR